MSVKNVADKISRVVHIRELAERLPNPGIVSREITSRRMG
jgi:hypothetical protein